MTNVSSLSMWFDCFIETEIRNRKMSNALLVALSVGEAGGGCCNSYEINSFRRFFFTHTHTIFSSQCFRYAYDLFRDEKEEMISYTKHSVWIMRKRQSKWMVDNEDSGMRSTKEQHTPKIISKWKFHLFFFAVFVHVYNITIPSLPLYPMVNNVFCLNGSCANIVHPVHLYVDKFIETYKTDRCTLFRFRVCFLSCCCYCCSLTLVQSTCHTLPRTHTHNIKVDATYDVYVLENILAMMTI